MRFSRRPKFSFGYRAGVRKPRESLQSQPLAGSQCGRGWPLEAVATGPLFRRRFWRRSPGSTVPGHDLGDWNRSQVTRKRGPIVRWGRLRPSVLRVLGIPFLAQPARLSIGYSPEISLRSVGKCRKIALAQVCAVLSPVWRNKQRKLARTPSMRAAQNVIVRGWPMEVHISGRL